MTAPDDKVTAELERLHRIEQAAMGGPWTSQKAVIAGIGGAYVIEHGEAEIALVDCAGDLRLEQEPADAEFIAEARTAMPRLLAAVFDLLKQHRPGPVTILGSLCERHANHRYFSIDACEAVDVQACTDCEATVYRSCTGCGHPVPVDSCPIRKTITRELTGKEAST